MEKGRTRRLWKMAKTNSNFHAVALMCLMAVLSYLVSQLGGLLLLRSQDIWPLWPGCALIVSVLLLVRRKIWPLLIAAGYAGFVLYDLQTGVPLGSIAKLILADTAEILIAAFCLNHYFNGVPRLNSLKALAKYSFFAIILAPLSVSLIGAFAFRGEYWVRWRVGFFSEALAFLTLTPAILGWADNWAALSKKPRAFYAEAATLMGACALLGYFIFVDSGKSLPPALLYCVVPLLLWSALRFGSTGVSTSIVVFVFFSIWGVVHGRGPFTETEPVNRVLSLQLFLFTTALPFLALAALVEEHKQDVQILRESEKRFRLVADTAPVMIWMSGTNKLCTYFNTQWLNFTGKSIESEVGNGWAEGAHPEDLKTCLQTYRAAFDRRESFNMVYRLRRYDGEYRWVQDFGVPRFNQEGSFAGYIGSCVDITERTLAEAALRENEDKLRLLLDSTAEAIYGIDLEGRCTFCNPACLRALGYERAGDLLGKNMHQLIHHTRIDGTAFPEEDCRLTRAMRDGEGVRIDNEVLWKADGTSFPAEYWSHPQRKGQKVVGAVAAFIDITERKAAEEVLASVSRRLIGAQEQERTRIARELHDDIGQRLALLTIGLERMRQSASELPLELLDRLEELSTQSSELAADVQSLSHELHSSKLEYLGVTTAMRGFCKEFAAQQKANISFAHDEIPREVPKEVSLCLFRILQEALKNAVKHSGVRHFDVELRYLSGAIHLSVHDSGSGFDVQESMNTQGLGLVSMTERLKLVNGLLTIDSQPHSGTTIHARVPLHLNSNSMRAAV
jgi:PAS domain S-box-containing protein